MGTKVSDAVEEEEVYGQSLTPDTWTYYKVFTKKIFLVSWTRWRLQQALVWPTVHAIIHLAFWIFFKWLLEQELETEDENMPEIDEVMLIIFRTLTPILTAMSMKTVLDKFVMEIISEKESKMMIVQHVNGLPPWVYWLSYLTYFAVTSLLPTITWTVMLLATALKGCGFFAVFLTIFLNFQHMFFWAVVLQTFFERARTVSALSSVTLLIPLLPIGFGYAGIGDPAYVDGLIIVLGFLPNFALAFWCQAVLSTSWYNPWGFNKDFFTPATLPFESGEFAVGAEELPSAGQIWLIFLAHLTVFAFFAYWFNQVWQGEFGSAKPLCFCCQRRRRAQGQGEPATAQSPTQPEAGPVLELSKLSKTFESRGWVHKAVDDVNLSVQHKELFALLGHNGSGKTTIINMISGILPMTSGQVKVLGTSCSDDIVQCRQNMSLCPQDNPMYESITVDEHLRFFAELRGSQNQDGEVAHVLEALGLQEKRRAKCGTLSGGQKRRLWVATSLLGQAALVFLDEPTSGMDPSSRRELWTLLLSMKTRGRSCLFTTHYLEEADLLADRKAVIARGKVMAMGSSKELKAQFGAGYHLRVMTPRGASQATLDQLGDVVQGHVRGALKEQVSQVERTQAADAPMEVRYTLPAGEIGAFGSLFLALEARREELQVQDFELAATSLEEVFMKLGKEGEGATMGDAGGAGVLDQEEELSAGVVSPKEHAKLLFQLRTTQTLMNKKVLLGTVLFPVLFTIFSMVHTTYFFTRHKMMQAMYGMYPGLIAAVACMRLPYMLIEERERKITQVMISMGMPRRVYWYTTLGHNALQVLAVTILSPILLPLGGETILDRGRWFFAVMASLLHVVPLSLFFFVVSCSCKTAENASKILNLLNVIFGMLTNILPSLLWNFEQDEMPDAIASVVHTVSSFLSPYYLLPGVLVGVWQAGGGDAYKCAYVEQGHEYADECFRVSDTAGMEVFAATWVFWAPWVGQTCLCIFLALLSYRLTSPKKQQGAPSDFTPEAKSDEDVQAEEARMRDAVPADFACVYRGLQHVFRDKSRTVHAVRGISLGVQRGECFGLLGPNGAGKTTTLGCLTGEIQPPTAGEVYVAGHSVTGAGAELAFKHLGFCPQVDPLFGDLTGRQHLLFYGRMKGIVPGKLEEVVNGLFQRLGFDAKDADKPAGTYSGGMKRKLSLAIALIGPSSVLFLDEPSAAVDAGAKRLLWQAIKMRAKSKSVIITTHSMEEAEAVCDRIGIQVFGSLRCLGTPIHLKLKYGSGYQMELRFKKDLGDARKYLGSAAEVTNFVQSSLSAEAQLLEAHDACYLYQLPRFKVGGLSLGQVFQGLQEASETYAIEEYSLVQPSLEQVFLRFAKEQQGIVAPSAKQGGDLAVEDASS